MSTRSDAAGHAIDRDPPETDRAECTSCKGWGGFRVLIGPDEAEEMCQDCLGTGKELTRADFERLSDHGDDLDLNDDEEWI